MIETADVFIENFVAGKLASMGLGYDDCMKINPRLIYASITGIIYSPINVFSLTLLNR